jgi:hypothetical protein
MILNTNREITMVTKIERVERAGDYDQAVLDLLPGWKTELESMLAIEYPDAEICIKILYNECGVSVTYVNCNDSERDEVETDIRHSSEECWNSMIF